MNNKDIFRESTSNKRDENRKEDAMRVFNPLKVSALTSIKPVTNDMPLKVMRLTLFKFN